MIHRAVLGSFERFMGIMIEHYGGSLPIWLSPEQVRVLPISEKTNEYASKVTEALCKASFRCSCDASGEKIGAKIARAHAEKLPCMLVVGPQEVQSNMVNVRIRGHKDSVSMNLESFLQLIQDDIKDKNENLRVSTDH
jgi:threonyl-tRNA synthetase